LDQEIQKGKLLPGNLNWTPRKTRKKKELNLTEKEGKSKKRMGHGNQAKSSSDKRQMKSTSDATFLL